MEKNEILVLYGSDPAAMAKRIAEDIELDKLIGSKDRRIGLKPNLVVASPADGGATTHPEILEGLIQYLQERGFSNIAILEGSWVGDRTSEAFRRCGFSALAAKYGVELIDLQKDSSHAYDCAGMSINICDKAMAVDFMINLPVLKGHCQTVVTCSLKNNKGVMPNSEKRRFHTLGLHKPIAHLNTVAKTDLIIVDGICGDLDFEEGGNPVPMKCMLAARDRVLCDAYVCELMGVAVDEVPYIRMAEQLGVGSADTASATIRELNRPDPASRPAKSGRKVEQLARCTAPIDACSACYGSLIHALGRYGEAMALSNIEKAPVCIGQGYKDKAGKCGVGNCTHNFEHFVKGCPPKASDILDFLYEQYGWDGR